MKFLFLTQKHFYTENNLKWCLFFWRRTKFSKSQKCQLFSKFKFSEGGHPSPNFFFQTTIYSPALFPHMIKEMSVHPKWEKNRSKVDHFLKIALVFPFQDYFFSLYLHGTAYQCTIIHHNMYMIHGKNFEKKWSTLDLFFSHLGCTDIFYHMGA